MFFSKLIFCVHRISISKRTILHVSDLEMESEVTYELLYLHTHLCVTISIPIFQLEASHDQRGQPRRISRQKFPKRTHILSIPSKPHSFHSVHSAIGSRMNGMIFRSFRKWNSSQKNTNASTSSHSRIIVPKEFALYKFET